MTSETQTQPAGVAAAPSPKQAGETPAPWWWVERSVWTDRMRTRRTQREPTTKGFSRWDKLWAPSNLLHGYYAVWRNAGAPGVAGQTGAPFEAQHAQELERLREELRQGPVVFGRPCA